MNWKINLPTSATCEGSYTGPATNTSPAANNWLNSSRRFSGTSSTGTLPVGGTATDGTPTNQTACAEIDMIVTMAGNAGSMTVQWAQGSATADAVTMRSGSYLQADRIG